MTLFKSKEESKGTKSLQDIVREKILTAEGWRRRLAPKIKKSK
jgi:hypothetical protein